MFKTGTFLKVIGYLPAVLTATSSVIRLSTKMITLFGVNAIFRLSDHLLLSQIASFIFILDLNPLFLRDKRISPLSMVSLFEAI